MKNVVCNYTSIKSKSSGTALLTATDSPDLIDEDHECQDLDETSIPNYGVGDKVKHARDGVTKTVKIMNLLLDPSQTQLLFNIKCSDNSII